MGQPSHHRTKHRDLAFVILFLHAVVAEFISQSSDLLLEDDRHSTRCHGHTAKYIPMSQLRKKAALQKGKAKQRSTTASNNCFIV